MGNGAPHQPKGGFEPPEEWHLLSASAVSPCRQMAIDHVLAESVWDASRPPAVRLYHWPAPGLTIGRHQRADGLAAPAVRRRTGGRAIYHEHELTFCLALPAGHRLIQPTVRATYHGLMAPFIAALERLGIAAAAPRTAPRLRPDDRIACFASPGEGEPMAGPHKLVAMAQRQTPRGLMAQGSIPITAPHQLPGSKNSAIYGLNAVLPGISPEVLKQAVIREMARCFGAQFTFTPLTAAESRSVTAIARSRYRKILSQPVTYA